VSRPANGPDAAELMRCAEEVRALSRELRRLARVATAPQVDVDRTSSELARWVGGDDTRFREMRSALDEAGSALGRSGGLAESAASLLADLDRALVAAADAARRQQASAEHARRR